jgi:hypothetical protein
MNARTIENLEFEFGRTDYTPAAIPITVAATNTKIAAANDRRKSILLQNNGTEPCIIRLGDSDASTTAYNFVLSDCTANRDGKGANILITNFQGAIQGIVESNTTVISITEMEKG